MSKTASQPGTAPAEADAAIAVGGPTSGQQGATLRSESQEETGGNGGPGMTRNQSGPYVNAPDGSDALPAPRDAANGRETVSPAPPARSEAVDAAMTHANPGGQDTRASQAGVHDTGLGARETGASQDEADLPPLSR